MLKRMISLPAFRLASLVSSQRRCRLSGKGPCQNLPSAFSLIEVALALSITSFCVVALLGLLPVLLHNFQQADNQSALVNLATSVAQDLNSTAQASSTQNSPRYTFPVPASGGSSSTNTLFVDASGALTAGPATSGALTAPVGSLYRVTVAFSPPATGVNATTARIMITFPIQASLAAGTWPTTYTSMLQTSVALNRN
jgi:uncharacterized protein (TIGR02598 family)